MNIPIKPDLIVMDGRISFVSGGPAIGLAVHPGVIEEWKGRDGKRHTGPLHPNGIIAKPFRYV